MPQYIVPLIGVVEKTGKSVVPGSGIFDTALSASSSISGIINVTGQDDSVSSYGSVLLNGQVSEIETNDTSSSIGSVLLKGSLSLLEVNDLLSSSGSTQNNSTGSINYTEPNDPSSSSAKILVSGVSSTTEINDILSAAGYRDISGSISVIEKDDTLVSFDILKSNQGSGLGPTTRKTKVSKSLQKKKLKKEQEALKKKQKEFVESIVSDLKSDAEVVENKPKDTKESKVELKDSDVFPQAVEKPDTTKDILENTNISIEAPKDERIDLLLLMIREQSNQISMLSSKIEELNSNINKDNVEDIVEDDEEKAIELLMSMI